MAWERIGLTIWAARPLAGLRQALRRTGIIGLDLDECVFPGFTQVALGRRVAARVLRRPARRRDRRLLPQLALGAALFGVKETKRLFGVDTPMRRLVAWYERVMRGVPEHYVEAAARDVPGGSYAFAAETIALLAEQAPAGLVSLGLGVVARAYLEALRGPSGPSLAFYEANTLRFRNEAGDRVCAGYDRGALLVDGADKRRALERRMAALGANAATVVGHSADDVPMAALARETGGVAIAYNPPRRLWDHFDVVVQGADWEPMYALAAMLAGVPRVASRPGDAAESSV